MSTACFGGCLADKDKAPPKKTSVFYLRSDFMFSRRRRSRVAQPTSINSTTPPAIGATDAPVVARCVEGTLGCPGVPGLPGAAGVVGVAGVGGTTTLVCVVQSGLVVWFSVVQFGVGGSTPSGGTPVPETTFTRVVPSVACSETTTLYTRSTDCPAPRVPSHLSEDPSI